MEIHIFPYTFHMKTGVKSKYFGTIVKPPLAKLVLWDLVIYNWHGMAVWVKKKKSRFLHIGLFWKSFKEAWNHWHLRKWSIKDFKECNFDLCVAFRVFKKGEKEKELFWKCFLLAVSLIMPSFWAESVWIIAYISF